MNYKEEKAKLTGNLKHKMLGHIILYPYAWICVAILHLALFAILGVSSVAIIILVVLIASATAQMIRDVYLVGFAEGQLDKMYEKCIKEQEHDPNEIRLRLESTISKTK